VALGGRVIEKHFTTDQSLPGGDNEMSILPEDLSRLLEGSSRIYSALGTGEKTLTATELNLLPLLRRSVALRNSLSAGDVITADNLTAVRPATGIPADQIDQVAGKRAANALEAFSPLNWEDLE
jgi:sialic acid synthase SpsE